MVEEDVLTPKSVIRVMNLLDIERKEKYKKMDIAKCLGLSLTHPDFAKIFDILEKNNAVIVLKEEKPYKYCMIDKKNIIKVIDDQQITICFKDYFNKYHSKWFVLNA